MKNQYHNLEDQFPKIKLFPSMGFGWQSAHTLSKIQSVIIFRVSYLGQRNFIVASTPSLVMCTNENYETTTALD